MLRARPEDAARLRAKVEAADARMEAFIAERLSTFLSSRKVAEDLSDRRPLEGLSIGLLPVRLIAEDFPRQDASTGDRPAENRRRSKPRRRMAQRILERDCDLREPANAQGGGEAKFLNAARLGNLASRGDHLFKAEPQGVGRLVTCLDERPARDYATGLVWEACRETAVMISSQNRGVPCEIILGYDVVTLTSDDPKVVRRIQIHAEIMRLMHELQSDEGSKESE